MKNKVEPRTLPGMMELLPQDQIQFNQIKKTIQEVYESFGYFPLDTPVIEYSSVLLAKAGGETEKQIYRFNKGDNDLSLRFDLTVPLAKYVAQKYNDLIFPFKRYQIGKVYRGERPQKGRYREFYQCDIDVIGNETLSLVYDAEIPAVIYNLFKKLNFGKFTIRINNRKILNGFFNSLELTEKTTDILRIIDKIDKIGAENVAQELNELGINDQQIKTILEFISIKGTNASILEKLKSLNISNELFTTGLTELEQTILYIKDFNVPEEYYRIDLTIARGLDYYTGTVYETILDNHPSLGSVCSGGKYENLTGYYTDQNLPGIGISIGLTRLFSKLKEENLIPEIKNNLIECLIVPLSPEYLNYAIQVGAKLREANIVTDVYYQEKNMKQKMKFADRQNIPYVIIIGEDEVKTNDLTVKNMLESTQDKLTIEQIIAKLKGE